MTINAITVREPYASLLMLGAKRIETRSWPAPASAIGQRIAIHAAKGLTIDELWTCYEDSFFDVLTAGGVRLPEQGLLDRSPKAALAAAFLATRGCIVATATLHACRRMPDVSYREMRGMLERAGFPEHELEFGDFSPGRYGWIVTDVERLAVPVPARGQQGIWQWEMPECVMTGDGFGRIA